MRGVRVRKLLRGHMVNSSQIGRRFTQLSQLRHFDREECTEVAYIVDVSERK